MFLSYPHALWEIPWRDVHNQSVCQYQIAEFTNWIKSSNNLSKIKSAFANHVFTEGHAIDLECPNVDVLHSNFRDTNYDINNLETLEILLAHKY